MGELQGRGLVCEECNTDEYLAFLDDLVDSPDCGGCNHIVCANCGHDAGESNEV